MSTPTPPTPPVAPDLGRYEAPSLAQRLSLLTPLAVMIVLLLLLGGSLVAGARWLLMTEPGAVWALARVPGLQVSGWQGALLDARVRADKLRYEWDGGKFVLVIDQLDAEGLQWQWRPEGHRGLAAEMKNLSATQVTLTTGPAGAGPATTPSSIAMPLGLRLQVQQARVALLSIDDLAPFSELQARELRLVPQDDGEHSVQDLALTAYGLRWTAQQTRMQTRTPLALQLQGDVQPVLSATTELPWRATLALQGPLARLQLSGKLRSNADTAAAPVVPTQPSGTGTPAVVKSGTGPQLDLSATLLPLNAWPLGALSLQTRQLDLAALWPQAPRTQISGSAELSSSAKDSPLRAQVALVNTLPGRWNEGRLPLRRLQAQVEGSLNDLGRLTLPRFELDFADGAGPAGRWTGRAQWSGHELALQTELSELTPQRLDGRAAAMRLRGPLTLQFNGLPSPDPAAGAPPSALTVSWKADLEGMLDGTPQAVRLAMVGSGDRKLLQLTRVNVSTGAASAELTARLQRGARGEWTLDTQGKLLNFEPLPWWPGEVGSAWRTGTHRVSADWALELQLPADTLELKPLALAQRVAGNGTLRLHDSQLAGVAVAADIALSYSQSPTSTLKPTPTPARLRAELSAGGNVLTLEGQGDPAGVGQADRLLMTLKADKLATLAPLARLHPLLQDWLPQQGSASATLQTEGRWPVLRTEGQVRASALRIGDVQLASATATWQLATGGNQPMSLQFEANGLQTGGPGKVQRADQLRAQLRGTLLDHRIEVAATLPLRPSAALAQLLNLAPDSGTRAGVTAQGSWAADTGAAGGGVWRGRIEQLRVSGWDGRSSAIANTANTANAANAANNFGTGPAWAEARDLRAELQFDRNGRLLSLQAEPGRIMVADVAALRWQAVLIDLRPERPLIDLRADIEAFAAAPVLSRLVPELGWSGDLRLAAKVEIRAAEKFDADIVFERRDGDLHVETDEGLRLLGLTDLKLVLSAHDGVWLFEPLFKGRSLGEISGSVKLSTSPQARWPTADAALEGTVQARVADLGIWGSWVPPGWRLSGELGTTATLSGRFGDPRFTGQLNGRKLGVRNLLQGVNISDGEIAVRLTGDSAQIDRFRLRGGDGSIDISGSSTLGQAPAARLLIKADRFRALRRVDRLIVLSGNAVLALTPNAGRLEGELRLDEGLYDVGGGDKPTLEDDITFRREGERLATRQEATAARPRRNFDIGLNIDLGDKLSVRGRGLDTQLRGKVRLSNPAGRLALTGSIKTEGGTYAAYGQKLEIERGVLAFSGALDNPRLDVLALRPNADNRVGVLVAGNLLTPRVRLYSDSDMSETEKLSWLVLGRAPDGLGRNDTALLQRAAVALLAGEGTAPTDALIKNLGLDELSVRQGEGEVRETVIILGKQLSRRWYVGYERGVNATTGTFQLIYRIAQRFTLRAQSGLENSLDVIWVWRVQETPADASMRKSRVVPP